VARAIHLKRQDHGFGGQAQWEYEPAYIKSLHLATAQAAIAACHADEALELLRLIRREYGGHLTVCGKTLVAVDNLLAKVEGKA
jgi:hypothetical protein